jgi:hypothetical protein
VFLNARRDDQGLALPCARRLGAGLELPLQRSDLLGERVALAP